MNEALQTWFRGGFEEIMGPLGSAEERTTEAVQLCVTEPTPASRTAATAAADEFLVSARQAGDWLLQHPAPDDQVNASFTECFAAYVEAAEILILMGEQVEMMTPEAGNRAAEAVARARRANTEGAYRFAELIGR